MSKQPSNAPGQKEQPPTKSAAVLLLGDIADTTWRMFVPTVGCTMLGLFLDKQWHTAPWLMIMGIVVGITVSGALVYRQLKRVNKLS